jgi:hypothetical protein
VDEQPVVELVVPIDERDPNKDRCPRQRVARQGEVVDLLARGVERRRRPTEVVGRVDVDVHPPLALDQPEAEATLVELEA